MLINGYFLDFYKNKLFLKTQFINLFFINNVLNLST